MIGDRWWLAYSVMVASVVCGGWLVDSVVVGDLPAWSVVAAGVFCGGGRHVQ
jgi:hypothetical protein